MIAGRYSENSGPFIGRLRARVRPIAGVGPCGWITHPYAFGHAALRVCGRRARQVTRVAGLEEFLVDLPDLAAHLQLRFAASCTVRGAASSCKRAQAQLAQMAQEGPLVSEPGKPFGG